MSAADRSLRLNSRPGEIIDRSRVVSFELDGRPIEGYEGDTVASALHASGVRTLSRSFKYHRPRGLFCVSGRCPNCLVTVNGVPNVRACTQTVEAGMAVRRQNAWPNTDRDLLSVFDRLGRFMPVGFYYKVFHRPKLLWQLAQPVIRRITGLGVLNTESVPDQRHRHRYLHADVAVIGGGPAGLSAALASASAGADTVLVDDQPDLGGTLLHEIQTGNENGDYEPARQLVDRVRSSDVSVMSRSTAFGLYQDNLVAVETGDEIVKLRAKRIVMATGCYEVPLVFENNDLPGVMLSSGVSRLLRLYGVRPGRTAVVATVNDQGYEAALDLLDSDVRVAAVVDARPEPRHGVDSVEVLKSRGVPILNGQTVTRAIGRNSVVAAEVTGLADGGRRRFDCDLICTSGGFDQSDSLLAQAGALRYDADLGEQVPRDLPVNVYVAGDITGIHDLRTSVIQGRLAGVEAAASLGHTSPDPDLETESLQRSLSTEESRYRSELRNGTVTAAASDETRRFICLCEDVTDKDVRQAIDEGFDDIQTLKRYSTVTMGPCQGKMCHKSLVGICASYTGRGIDETGATTARPPLHPVTLGALAGPSHRPIRHTPMHHRNVELGASMADLGPWRRPHSYGSPEEECRAVRERVGIIDVSSLGKLRVGGQDAAALLDRVYTGRVSDLRVGRVRYGLICADSGAILDDGTVTRLADDDYFVTTTTGNTELMEEWLRWWTAGTRLCAHVTNVTSAFGAVNVAGPRARDTLSGITDVDLSPGAFRYMRSARGTVAGVPSILLRIGFVGETGWEVYFPAEYGEHMWDAIMGAGERFGIAPFGLEAQRILRLEKGHIIVGQDTDSATSPLEAGMGWAVASDKGDFIGKSGIQAAEECGIRSRIVGFVVRDGRTAEDGDPVVAGGSPIGRVTSARMSPTKHTGIGLAWVPVELADEGREIVIRAGDVDLAAQVTLRPVYDPDGARLRD